jgi:hypothetical protein
MEESHMRGHRIAGSLALLVALMVASTNPLAAATPTRFGSRLTSDTQPTSIHCPETTGTAKCTWFLTEAYHRPGGEPAPRDGVIGKIRIIARTAGSFRLYLGRWKPAVDRGKVIRKGPLFNYQGQPDDGTYTITAWNVSIPVHKGDYLVIKANRSGFVNCSGQETHVIAPPLAVGDPFAPVPETVGCSLLLEAVYKS